MIFKQFRYEPLGAASYLLGCARAREALVVDPIGELGAEYYVLEAADRGLDVAGVLETHVHADFVSCARELAEMTGAPHYLHEAAEGLVRYGFTPLADGQVVTVGQVDARAIHTPGHTPEHTCYVVTDRSRSEEPWCVLTGDSLFVGDVGRPDLLVGEQALDVFGEEERAELQFRSIREKLFALPDHVEVYPNHYGGSTCGGVNMSGKASSTIFFEKRHNLALKRPDVKSFLDFVHETAKPFPENYQWIKSYNLGLISKEELEGAVHG
jgi:glyoxylase-like metal-dependent hydrolase (beta-lactamase superfamily II)